MYRGRRGFLSYLAKGAIGLAGVYVLSKIPLSYATGSGIQIGTGSVPNVNGVWESDEWDDAVQLPLKYLARKINDKGQAFLRLKHNYDGTNLSDARLFGIGDILSDDGSIQSKDLIGGGFLSFNVDSNDDGSVNLTTPDPADYHFLIDSYDGKNYLCEALNGWNADSFTKGANKAVGASTIGVSPNSNVNHRMIEFSLPLEPILKYAPSDQGGNRVIGFQVFAVDSYNNALSLFQGVDQLGNLTFGAIPLPEPGEVLLPASLAITSYAATRYSKDKRRLSRRNFLGISALEKLKKHLS
jgi:hypothetical protein